MICVLSSDASTTGIFQTVLAFTCSKEHYEMKKIINLKQLKEEVI